MRCPYCGKSMDCVVDSREARDGLSNADATAASSTMPYSSGRLAAPACVVTKRTAEQTSAVAWVARITRRRS